MHCKQEFNYLGLWSMLEAAPHQIDKNIISGGKMQNNGCRLEYLIRSPLSRVCFKNSFFNRCSLANTSFYEKV
jgi:hypothetical protein